MGRDYLGDRREPRLALPLLGFSVLFVCGFVPWFVKGPQGPPVCTQQTSRAKGPRGLLESHRCEPTTALRVSSLCGPGGHSLLDAKRCCLRPSLGGSLWVLFPFLLWDPCVTVSEGGKLFHSQASGSKGSQASVGSEACLMHHAL